MQKIVDNLYKQAERMITSNTMLSKLLDDVFLKIGDRAEQFYKIQDSLIALTRMLKSWIKKDYQNISTTSIITIVVALLYFVNPLDIIPDFIPIIGRLDDLLVLSYLIKTINKEIEQFMAWEKENAVNAT